MNVQLSPKVYNGGYHIRCHGDNNGQINAIIIGGTSPFTYSWSTGANTQNIANRITGTYTVTVTQSGGSTVSAQVSLHEPVTLDTSLYSSTYDGGTNVSEAGGSDGKIILTDQGGTPPYQYLWSNTSQEQDQYNLAAKTYTVTVTDVNNCSTTRSITLTEPTPLAITNLTSPDYNTYNVHCHGGTDGAINLTITGGIPPYDILWNNGSFDEDPTGLPAGEYAVRVIDQNGTAVEGSITLTEPTVLSIELTPFSFPNGYNISMYGAYDGSINTNPAGGLIPYTYLWNDGTTTQNRTILNKGIKSVLLTDLNGCEVTSEISLSEPTRDDWTMQGNANTNPAANFIGTVDNKDLVFKTNNIERFMIDSIGKVKFNSLSGTGDRMVVADQNGLLKANLVPWVTLGNDNINSDYSNDPLQFIGTINNASFVIRTYNVERMRVNPSGSVGIGTGNSIPTPNATNNPSKLAVFGSVTIGGYCNVQNTPVNGLLVEGPVGIGTTTIPSNYKLLVEGHIGAREVVVVKPTDPWPDYVFSKNYIKPTLKQLEIYVNKNKHLPGLPSASEINKNGGFSLGACEIKHLEKTDEAFLYIFELKNEIELLKKENEKIGSENIEIKKLLKIKR